MGGDTVDRPTAALRTHLRQGRLSPEEFADRAERVGSASTDRHAAEVFADLPLPHPNRERGLEVSGYGAVAVLVYGLGFAAPLGVEGTARLVVAAVVAAVFVLLMHRDGVLARRKLRTKPLVSPDRVRIGHPERTAAADALLVHYAAGQLTFAEYRDRLAQLPELSTGRQLRRVFADLPWPHPDLLGAVVSRHLFGALSAVHALAWYPGIPAAIMVGVDTGQWYWLPVTVAAAVLLASRKWLRRPRVGRYRH